LMVGVVLAALGSFTMRLTFSSQILSGERAAVGILTLVLFGLQAMQWGLASIPSRRVRPDMDILLGILSYLVAMSTFVGLFILAAAFPQGAALIVVTMLVLVVYRTSWD